MAVLRDILDAIMHRRSSSQPDSDLFSVIGSYQRTPAEIYASVTPTSYLWTPGLGGGNTLNVFRFFSPAQISSCLAQDGLVDMTLAIQAASNFLEGQSVANAGGAPHPGGTLFFPGGLYNINPALLAGNTLRIGGNVRFKGDKLFSSTLNSINPSFTGTLISLGPDNSGFFPSITGNHAFGCSIESMRISLFNNNLHGVIIGTIGAHQGSHLEDIRIEGINQVGVSLGGNGGPAYFYIKDMDIEGGTTEGLATTRQGLFLSTGSIVEVETFSCEGQAGHNVDIGIRNHNGSLVGQDFHFENASTGVFFDTGGTNSANTINGISGNSSVGKLIWIPAGYNGTVTAISINGLTGSSGTPICIQNDNTSESYVNTMVGMYSWSGPPGIQAGSIAFSQILNHYSTHVLAQQSVLQALAQNTLVTLLCTTVVNDALGEWATGTGLYTAKSLGYIRCRAQVTLVSAAWAGAPALFLIGVQKNGSSVATKNDPNQANLTIALSIDIDVTILVAKGDTINFIVEQGGVAAGVNTDNSPARTYICIDRVV